MRYSKTGEGRIIYKNTVPHCVVEGHSQIAITPMKGLESPIAFFIPIRHLEAEDGYG